METKAKIFIGVCSHDKPEWPHVISTQAMVMHASQAGLTCGIIPHVGESMISRGRCDVLADFMQSDYDYLMTVDDDIEFPIETVTRLYAADKDIIGGFYRIKKAKKVIAQRLLDSPPFEEYYGDMLKKRKVVQIKYLSTGCMMVKREVIVAMQNHYTELKYQQNESGRTQWGLYLPYIHGLELLSEDWSFCQRAIDIGYEVWADGSILCTHYGKSAFPLSGNELMEMEKKDETEHR